MLRFLRGEFESTDRAIPTAAKQLNSLVVLALNAGRPVSRETLRAVLYDENDGEWVSNSALSTPLSRLRSNGWPIARNQFRLELAPKQVDILDFDARAKEFIEACQSVRDLSNVEIEHLLADGHELDNLWAADPAEAFRDDERVAALFRPFASRRERFAEKLRELNEESQRRVVLSPTAQSPLVTAYLRDIVKRGVTLAFGNPTSWTSGNASDELITLDDLWTPLRVADSLTRSGNRGTHESMTEQDLGTELLALVESTNEPLIVLGEPGSGKSTSVAMLAARAARQGGVGLLPIWAHLGSVIPNSRLRAEELLLSGVPEIEVAVRRGGAHAGVELTSLLENAMLSGQALVLLDGLDEVKEHSLDAVRSAVATVAKLNNCPRLIVTCRSFDYRQNKPNRKIPIQRELELLSLNAEEKASYVSRWYSAAERAGGFTPALAHKLSDALQHELRSTEVIAEMANLPLLLALLTLIHSRQELPDSRSVVCDQAIKFMLAETPPWRERAWSSNRSNRVHRASCGRSGIQEPCC